VVDAAVVVALGVVIFTVIGVVGLGLATLFGQAHPGPAAMVGGTVLAGCMVLPLILGTGYYVAVMTDRFGLDPDNHAVPIITSLMDLTGVVALFVAMSISGVAVHG
jgi:mgtE-like transporter